MSEPAAIDALRTEDSSSWTRRAVAAATALGPLFALVLVIVFFGVADRLKEGQDVFLTAQNARTVAVQAAADHRGGAGHDGNRDRPAGSTWPLVRRSRYRRRCSPGACKLTTRPRSPCWPPLPRAARPASRTASASACWAWCRSSSRLGTMTIYLGIGKKLANETTIRPNLTQVPHWFETMVTPQPEPAWLIHSLGVPNFAWGVWLALVLAALVALVLRYTVFGRYVFALGSNEQTARLCGINVPLTKIAVYTLGGLFVGLAGIYQFARLQTGNPMSGTGLELKMIAAVVIGGGSLSGGRGSILGTVAGAIMTAAIGSGCTLLGYQKPGARHGDWLRSSSPPFRSTNCGSTGLAADARRGRRRANEPPFQALNPLAFSAFRSPL